MLYYNVEVWKSALTSTFFISLVPNLLLYLIPSRWFQEKNQKYNLKNVMMCFAAGGLLGDVLLHAIPHLMLPHDHDHHDHYISEHDAHISEFITSLSPDIASEKHSHQQSLFVGIHVLIGYLSFFVSESLISLYMTEESDEKCCHASHDGSLISPQSWLNISADVMHNFTDGIAIGASFASGKGLGIAAFLSIFFHEVPHEIGDFAMLISGGMRWV